MRGMQRRVYIILAEAMFEFAVIFTASCDLVDTAGCDRACKTAAISHERLRLSLMAPLRHDSGVRVLL